MDRKQGNEWCNRMRPRNYKSDRNQRCRKAKKTKANQRERDGLNRSKVSTGCNGFAGRGSTHAKWLI